jgi:SAM-dependent methyltransferase
MFDTYEEIFAARAASYQAAMDRLPRARDREFLTVIEPVGARPGDRLCDMPAGGGYLQRYLPPDVAYVAVEPSALFVANCPQGPNCTTVQAPIEHVPLPAGSMDHVVSLAGLHHCPDLAAVFGEMRRLLRPGGTLVVADVACGTPPAVFLNGYVDANNPLGHRGTFLDADTAGLLRAASFELVDDRAVEIPWTFDSAEDAGRYCSALFGIERIAPEEVAAAMTRELGTCPGSGRHTIRWELRRIICRAA